MKKIFLTGIFILVAASQVLFAIPAKPGKFVRIQPDGTTITLQRHGDEFYHWTTDGNGTVMERGSDGFFRPGSMPSREHLGGRASANAAAAAIRAKRAAASSAFKAAGAATVSHFPVVLVQFSDRNFASATANDDFSRLLNERGYSENGGTGSVHDYYWENSMETFDAVFDVYGPYTYNGTVADNAEEVDAAKILWAVIKANDDTVDWSQYDNDRDGVVDMVFMYYAGWNEAEGEDDTIWPHKYDFSNAGVKTSSLDGKSFDIYACTSELKGTSSSNGGMCGIGTAAHEFSHTQGLPDFYDVNYANYSGDSECGATYTYDIMCGGGYNNEGRTPPYFNAEERILMGWMAGYTSLPSSGTITVPSLSTANMAYKMDTKVSNEYFVFECRPGTGWDAYVEPGMVVYHVDKSSSHSIKYYNSNNRFYTFTAAEAWGDYYDYNIINADGTHPCFYIIPAADQANLNYEGWKARIPFPGSAGISFYTPKDWAGSTYSLLNEIAFNPSGSYEGTACEVVTFVLGKDDYPSVSGRVHDQFGEAVAGATVNIYSETDPLSNVIHKISGRLPENLRETVETDGYGMYLIDMSDYVGMDIDIEVISSGYITKYETLSITDSHQIRNFLMRDSQEPKSYTLKKYLDVSHISGFGYPISSDLPSYTALASICFSAEELEPYAGRKILKLGFEYSLGDSGTASEVYGIIDFGSTRKLTTRVSSPVSDEWNVVDVSEADLYIPSGTDCYFGYALKSTTYSGPMLYSKTTPMEGGMYYGLYASSNTSWQSSSSWNINDSGNLLVYVVLDDATEVDYNYIYNPGYGTYTVGDEFALTLVEAAGDRKPGSEIVWYFDDEKVATSSTAISGKTVTLKYPGNHLVEARFTTRDGKTKVVELALTVGL